MNNFLIVAALGATAIAGVAIAQPDMPPPGSPDGHGPGHGMMMRVDTNNDGVVTREEILVPADKHFDMLDANHDGQISRDEFRARPLKHFAMVDANHDGRIDASERQAMRAKMREHMGKMRRGWKHEGMDDMPSPPTPMPGKKQ